MNGIQIKYVELLRLSIEQLFYQNKMYKQTKTQPELDIQILPTQHCADVMTRLNIIFRNTDANGGFILLARVSGTNDSGDSLLQFLPKKEDALSFLMILKNPDVINFNDLPVQPAINSIYYFNNEVNDAAAPRNHLHLSKSATGVDGTNDVIKKSNENYYFHVASPVTPGTAKVKHLLSGQMLAPISLVNEGGQADLSFNLSSIPIGKCQLLINNISVDEFYYLERHAGRPVFGIIELSLSQTPLANYRIIEPDRSLNAVKPYYSLSFNNRETFWRYNIHLQSTSALYLEMAALPPADKVDFINKLNIVCNDPAITFSRTASTDTEFVFESDTKLFLQEKYFVSGSDDMLSLTLKKYISDVIKEAAVKTNLPYPKTKSIDASASQIYSDIFLTL